MQMCPAWSYLDTSWTSLWNLVWTKLKSSLANLSSTWFFSPLWAYASIFLLASSLRILWWYGSSKAWVICSDKFAPTSFLESLRSRLVNDLASFSIFSSSYARCEASNKLKIPRTSRERSSLKLPFWSLNLSKTSAPNRNLITWCYWGKIQSYNSCIYDNKRIPMSFFFVVGG